MSAVLTQRAMRPALRRAWGPRAPGCGRAAFQTDAGAGQHAGAPRTPLRFLVIDGYSAEGRAELSAGGASTAGVLYRKMLDRCSPVGATSDIAHPADDGFEAPDMSCYDGVAWTGCSLTIYADDPRVKRQIEFARSVFDARIPSFGSCWSAQIAVAAAGGVCARNPRGREMGIARKIALTPEGRAHPMYVGKPSVFDAFISHEDEVTHLPPGASVLASNAFTAVQSVAVSLAGGDFWAVQYHPEYDLHELARLTHCRIKKLVGLGFFRDADSASAYVADLEALHADPSRALPLEREALAGAARYGACGAAGKDIAWRLGIDSDVMNEDVRCVEVKNWIAQRVVPFRRTRLGLP